MKLYILYDKQQNKLIGEIKDLFSADKRHVFGAINPEEHANLLEQMVLSTSLTEIKKWHNWLITSIQNVEIIMSDNHGFALENVVIKELNISSAPILQDRS